MNSTAEKKYHKTVLTDEVIHFLNPKPGGIYIDATFGGGGHTRALLEHSSNIQVIAFDWDMVALEKNGEQLVQEFPDRLTLVWANFAQLEMQLKKIDVKKVDGIIADFGTSQFQIHERDGFSFNVDSPLDMRMSPAHQKITAAYLLRTLSERELSDILYEYGEEKYARHIARAIVAQRKEHPIKTTKQLATLIESIYGSTSKKKIHPATQTFQALRIAVNKELENIRSFLVAAFRVLKPSGRLVCISFHSLEDRLVKEHFKNYISAHPESRLLTPKAVIPTNEEVARNKASRSAKLRALEI